MMLSREDPSENACLVFKVQGSYSIRESYMNKTTFCPLLVICQTSIIKWRCSYLIQFTLFAGRT